MSTTTNTTSTATASGLPRVTKATTPVQRIRHGYTNLAAHGTRIQALVSKAVAQGLAPLEVPAIRQALRSGMQALVEVEAARLPRMQPRTA
jgi:hypothetical protein